MATPNTHSKQSAPKAVEEPATEAAPAVGIPARPLFVTTVGEDVPMRAPNPRTLNAKTIAEQQAGRASIAQYSPEGE